jgi:hypothetical protein
VPKENDANPQTDGPKTYLSAAAHAHIHINKGENLSPQIRNVRIVNNLLVQLVELCVLERPLVAVGVVEGVRRHAKTAHGGHGGHRGHRFVVQHGADAAELVQSRIDESGRCAVQREQSQQA